MEQLSFKLNAFEGPLDLLLSLIRKNKVSIYDIPISLILDQYLEAMEQMKEMDLEVSSEFLVLAATLLQIKSKMLLPAQEEEEEETSDPRAELVERLLAYKKYKMVASFLQMHENAGSQRFYKAPDIIERPAAQFNYDSLTPENLLRAFHNASVKLERRLPPPKHSFVGIVGHEKVSVRSKVRWIWTSLLSRGKVLFRELFHRKSSRPEAVAAFLAVLEMIKIKKIRVEYNGTDTGDFTMYKTDDEQEFNLEGIED